MTSKRETGTLQAVLALCLVAGLGCSSPSDPTGVEPTETLDTWVSAERVQAQSASDRYVVTVGVEGNVDVAHFEWSLGPAVPSGGITPSVDDTAWSPVTDEVFEVTVPWSESSAARGSMARTLWVRAVGTNGVRDTTPATLTFASENIAPFVFVEFPRRSGASTCETMSRRMLFGWAVYDPDETPGLVEVRTLVLWNEDPAAACYTRQSYFAEDPISPTDPNWSDWTTFDPEGGLFDPGNSLEVEAPVAGASVLIAVQARDAGGATSTVYQWDENVRHFRSSFGLSPRLDVYSDVLGAQFGQIGVANSQEYVVPSDVPIAFRWSADASAYAGMIVGYRYGWTLVDPGDPLDPGWVESIPFAQESAPRIPGPGADNFVIQAVDDSGGISRVEFRIQVLEPLPLSEQRDVLLVLDDPTSSAFLRDSWIGYLDELVFDFDRTVDVADPALDPATVTPFELMRYRSVIWVVQRPAARSHLAESFAPQTILDYPYNPLEAYQRRMGNLLLVGPGVTGAMSADEVEFEYPIIFNTSFGPPFGFGIEDRLGALHRNRGTFQWPYTGWCLESRDLVRPPIGAISGEYGEFLRTVACDGLEVARVANVFVVRNPGASRLSDLLPTSRRTDLESNQGAISKDEEFYNVDVTDRIGVVFALRDCQLPMFVHESRLDAGLIDDPPTQCPEADMTTSVVTGAPIAIQSSRYAGDKPRPGTNDYLWGFDPTSFERDGVIEALRWVLLYDWNLATAKR